MSLSAATRDRLRETGIAGGSVFRDVRPDVGTLPAIVIIVVSDPQPSTYAGRTLLRETRLQIDCIARSRGEADDLATATISNLEGAAIVSGVRFSRAFVSDVRRRTDELPGGDTVFTTSPDLYVWHQPAA